MFASFGVATRRFSRLCRACPHRVGDRLGVIEPTLPLRRRLDVWWRFVAWDGDVPRVTRRTVKVYTSDGQFVAGAGDQDGEGPIHFSLTPGRYVVASEDRMQWRKLQVEVKDGRDTIVAESRWDAAPLLSSSDTDRPTQMAAH